MKNNLIITLVMALVCAGCASNSAKSVLKSDSGKQDLQQGDTLYLAVDVAEDSLLQGQFDFDELQGGAGGMLYPGYDAASFLVGIAVHAAVANSAKDRQKQSVIEQANRVVEKYQSRVKSFAAEELFNARAEALDSRYAFAIRPAVEDAEAEDNTPEAAYSWVLTSKPVFYMTQDERELILQNVVQLTRADEPKVVHYENLVEVASVPVDEQPLEAYWLAEGQLEAQLGQLFEESLALAADDVLQRFDGATAVQMTFRYVQGGEREIQRGTLVQAQCERVVLRTLRGWLKSLPVSSVDDGESLTKSDECERPHRTTVGLVTGAGG